MSFQYPVFTISRTPVSSHYDYTTLNQSPPLPVALNGATNSLGYIRLQQNAGSPRRYS